MWSKRAPYTLGDLALRGFCVTAARLRPLLHGCRLRCRGVLAISSQRQRQRQSAPAAASKRIIAACGSGECAAIFFTAVARTRRTLVEP
jgi:hypothetical protein